MLKVIFSTYSVLLSFVGIVSATTYLICGYDNPKDAYDRKGAKELKLIIAVATISAAITSYISLLLPE